MRRALRTIQVAVVLALVALALAACEQGVGERCQVQSDCEDGLVCNKATNQCQNQTEVDAGTGYAP